MDLQIPNTQSHNEYILNSTTSIISKDKGLYMQKESKNSSYDKINPNDISRGASRRKRSDRVKLKESGVHQQIDGSQLISSNKFANPKRSNCLFNQSMQSDLGFRNVSNMDQFANFLLSQQNMQNMYSSEDDEEEEQEVNQMQDKHEDEDDVQLFDKQEEFEQDGIQNQNNQEYYLEENYQMSQYINKTVNNAGSFDDLQNDYVNRSSSEFNQNQLTTEEGQGGGGLIEKTKVEQNNQQYTEEDSTEYIQNQSEERTEDKELAQELEDDSKDQFYKYEEELQQRDFVEEKDQQSFEDPSINIRKEESKVQKQRGIQIYNESLLEREDASVKQFNKSQNQRQFGDNNVDEDKINNNFDYQRIQQESLQATKTESNLMNIKESPIKQINSTCKKNQDSDISYIKQDFNVTPKSRAVSHFSPATPISELNNLVTQQQHTPNSIFVGVSGVFVDGGNELKQSFGREINMNNNIGKKHEPRDSEIVLLQNSKSQKSLNNQTHQYQHQQLTRIGKSPNQISQKSIGIDKSGNKQQSKSTAHQYQRRKTSNNEKLTNNQQAFEPLIQEQQQLTLKNSVSQQIQVQQQPQQQNLNHTQQINASQPLQQQQQQCDLDKNFMLMQYEFVLQQLNQQVQKLLVRNQELEQVNLSNELIITQSKQVIQDLQGQIQQEKLVSDQRTEQLCKSKDILENELEKHKQVLQFYSNELDLVRQDNFELEQKLIQQQQQNILLIQRLELDSKQKQEELSSKLRQSELALRKKEEDIFKLRQDNQSMFSDLKGLAINEEQLKEEMQELKLKRAEMEMLIEDLQEKSQNQELKIKNQSIELDKVKKDSQSSSDSMNAVSRQLEELRNENDSLRDKLQIMEQEKLNLINEKERRERDCKNMQTELNRINSMVHNFKNLSGGNAEFQFNQTQTTNGTNGNNSYSNGAFTQSKKSVSFIHNGGAGVMNQSDFEDTQNNQSISWLSSGQKEPSSQKERQVFKNNDLNLSQRVGQQNFTDMMTVQTPHTQTWSRDNEGQNMGYKKGGVSNNRQQNQFADYSPIKKSDPNVPYAQRQKMLFKQQQQQQTIGIYNQNQPVSYTGFNGQNGTTHQSRSKEPTKVGAQSNVHPYSNNLSSTLQNLLGEKQRLESEYSKIPITINGKSMQIKKKKEELEFELDVIERNISQVKQKLKDSSSFQMY